jgi:multidrug resistance efflux pump
MIRHVTPRRAGWIGALAVALYATWLGGPYLYSIFVRDAAVTTWRHVATAPIPGELDSTDLRPGSLVPAHGRLATLVNPLADRTALAQAEAAVVAATARAAQFARVVAQHRARRSAYAGAFTRDLEQRTVIEEATLVSLSRQVEVERANAQRIDSLLSTGSAPRADADAASARLAAIQAERTITDGSLRRNRARRDDAALGVYLAVEGQELDWAARYDPLLLEREALGLAHELASARATLAATRDAYSHRARAVLTAPPGTVIWNRDATPGSHVEAGAPVISWIDPSVVLIDAPVSDLEISLLAAGTRALVMIEGERRPRDGVVLLTRGSGAPLGAHELAATARGRVPGIAQVLVRLTDTTRASERLVIGHPAHVTFPSVSVLRLLRARLRW